MLKPTEPSPSRLCSLSQSVSGRAVVRGMRVDHDAQRILLQVRELRRHERLQLVFLAVVAWERATR